MLTVLFSREEFIQSIAVIKRQMDPKGDGSGDELTGRESGVWDNSQPVFSGTGRYQSGDTLLL